MIEKDIERRKNQVEKILKRKNVKKREYWEWKTIKRKIINRLREKILREERYWNLKEENMEKKKNWEKKDGEKKGLREKNTERKRY